MNFIRKLDDLAAEGAPAKLSPAPRDEVMAILPAALELLSPPQVEKKVKAGFFDADDGGDGGDDDMRGYELRAGVAILDISGPLMQRGGFGFYSYYMGYDGIRASFENAMMDPACGSVLLRISSPGGSAAGCFEAVRAMRAAKVAAGKPCLAFADEAAYSAAYALACVADTISLPPEGGVGSVGVISVLTDWTKNSEMKGVKVAVITSGAFKGDGHGDKPMTDEMVARWQARVDGLAANFASLVGDARQLSTADVLAKQAGCFYGQQAVREGFADSVSSFDRCFQTAAAEAGQYLAKSPLARTMTAPLSSAQENPMTIKTTDLAAIAATLGLPADATIEQINQAAAELRGAKAEAESTVAKVCAQVGAKSASALEGKLDGVLNLAANSAEAAVQLAQVRAERKAMQVERDMAAAEQLFGECCEDGRITPAEATKVRVKLAAKGEKALEWLTDMVDTRVPNPALAEVHAPTDEQAAAFNASIAPRHVPRPGQKPPRASAALTAEDTKAMRKGGVTEKNYRATQAMMDDGLGLYPKPGAFEDAEAQGRMARNIKLDTGAVE